MTEVKEAVKNGKSDEIEEEYGDLLFAVVNLGRHLKVTPEIALTKASDKFVNRFKEMEEKGFLRKETSAEDGRIVYVSITEQGKQMSYEYNQKTFEKLVECMVEISEEEINCTIATIDKMYRIMSERRMDHA